MVKTILKHTVFFRASLIHLRSQQVDGLLSKCNPANTEEYSPPEGPWKPFKPIMPGEPDSLLGSPLSPFSPLAPGSPAGPTMSRPGLNRFDWQ